MSPAPTDFSGEPGSFRDRHARVLYRDGCVFRALSAKALRHWEMLAATRFFERFRASGRIVATEAVSTPACPPGWSGLLRHETIPFVSYPYEWPFGMLQDAARLQLELLLAALDEGLSLKDATPYNVQWRGCDAVFIDVASFEPERPGHPWIAHGQFLRLFLYPLMLQAYKNCDFHPWLRGSLEGIDAASFHRLMAWTDLLRPGVLTQVWMAGRLQERGGGGGGFEAVGDATLVRQMVRGNATRLLHLVEGLRWRAGGSTWSGYAEAAPYSAGDEERKKAFVRTVAEERRWRLAWDLGANTGVYSAFLASNAEYVVALDADHLAVERHFRALQAAGTRNVLPLVANLADPSPAQGWRGSERRRLEARGRPDLVLCLALLHHVCITANLPLDEVVEWLASLGATLVVEFVTREDPMVRTLLRQKDDDYPQYDLEAFEAALHRSFHVVCREPLATRILYHAVPLA